MRDNGNSNLSLSIIIKNNPLSHLVMEKIWMSEVTMIILALTKEEFLLEMVWLLMQEAKVEFLRTCSLATKINKQSR